MKRKIYDRLLEWKRNEATGAAFMIDGARRVGKSYIAEAFAKNEYRSYVMIDFAKVPKEVKSLFERYQDKLDTLFLKLSEYFGVRLHERETLMYPMDFEEFLWAKGDDMTMDFVRSHYAGRESLGQLLHRKVLDAFREYMIVGGMPQAVAEFVKSADLGKVDAVKRRIIKLYREDIRKHAGRYALKTEQVFDSLAAQLSRHEKKFRLSSLGVNVRMREYEDAFLWLKEAMVVNVCYRSTEPSIGLGINADSSTLKCYAVDTGLLISLAFSEKQVLAEQIHKRLLFDSLELNKGMLVENVVAQLLAAAGYELYFFSTSSESARSERMEIDFLIPAASIGRSHNIRPVEVKSSKRYDHTSLDKFRAKYRRNLSPPVVLHTKDVAEKDGVTYLPLYMASLL